MPWVIQNWHGDKARGRYAFINIESDRKQITFPSMGGAHSQKELGHHIPVPVKTEQGKHTFREESVPTSLPVWGQKPETMIIQTHSLVGSLSARIMNNKMADCYRSEISNTDVLLIFNFRKVGLAFSLFWKHKCITFIGQYSTKQPEVLIGRERKNAFVLKTTEQYLVYRLLQCFQFCLILCSEYLTQEFHIIVRVPVRFFFHKLNALCRMSFENLILGLTQQMCFRYSL